MNANLLTFLLIVTALTCKAQYESANWYLHDITGLNFTCDPPKRFDINFDSSESCSISDSNGSVVIYSNAAKLWNNKGEVIKNGNVSFGKDGDNACFSSIIPFPGKDSTYFFFRLGYDSTQTYPPGIRPSNGDDIYYSVIDMKANQGRGEVLQKNVKLTNNLHPNTTSYEFLCITGSPDRKKFWMMTYFEDSRLAGLPGRDSLTFYRIDETGISAPLRYAIDRSSLEFTPRFSPAGDRIAFGISENYRKGIRSAVVLYEFDFASGAIGPPTTLHYDMNIFGAAFEFSSDGNFLYVPGYDPVYKIVQFDLRSHNETEINSTARIVFNDETKSMGCQRPQLGIDGKIYYVCADGPIEKKRYGLWAIPRPNQGGVECGGFEFFSALRPGNFTWRLPTFPASFQFNDSDSPLNAKLLKTSKPKLNLVSIDKDIEPSVNIEFEADTENFSGTYLYRKGLADSEWTKETEIKVNKGTEILSGIRSDTAAYQFRIKGYDNYCKYEASSSVLNTIYLKDSIGESQKDVRLTWNHYDSACVSQVRQFEIWKKSGEGDFEIYQTLTGSTFDFYDSALWKSDGLVNLRIKGYLQNSDKVIWSNTVELEFKPSFLIPNVITPNGDSKNDYFAINYLNTYPNNKLTIFNKWGKKIFEKDGYNNDWAGDSITGIYYYTLVVYFKDGSYNYYKGWIQVIN